MAITSEIIGKLGGGEVNTIGVSTPSKIGSTVLAHIDVPPGKEILVAVKGVLSRDFNSSSMHEIRAGGTPVGAAIPGTSEISACTMLTQSAEISISIVGLNAASFTGHVYTVKI